MIADIIEVVRAVKMLTQFETCANFPPDRRIFFYVNINQLFKWEITQ